MTHESNGKSQVLLWALGILQVVLLGLGTFALMGTIENQINAKVLEAKQINMEQVHIKDMSTVEKSMCDLKETVNKMNGNVEDIKMLLIKRGR